jgi:hypothetical protein
MPYQPTSGDVVRVNGFDGKRAIVLKFNRQTDGAPYFKAKIENTSELVWPDHVVADSEGAYVRECTDCEITFRTDRLTDPLCPNCERRSRRQGGPGRRTQTGARVWRGR